MCPRCHGCLVHFADKANYAFLCAMEINVQDEIVNRKITASCPNKYIFQTIIQNVTNTKSELWKTNRLTSFQKLPMPIPFCLFVPSFIFAVLLIPSLNVLSDYFLVCQFGGGFYCLNIDKTPDTAPLMARKSL